MFPLLYWFVLDSPASWIAYVHAGVIFGLMGLTYMQSTRRRMNFMPMMVVMIAILLLDVIAYLPYLFWLMKRGRPSTPHSGLERSVE